MLTARGSFAKRLLRLAKSWRIVPFAGPSEVLAPTLRQHCVRQATDRLRETANFVGRFVGIAVAALIFVGCTVQLEPSYDARIVKEIETLTLETETFFASLADGIPAAGYQGREKTYVALAGRAGAIKVYAEARPAPSGKLVDFFQNLIVIPAPPKITAAASGERETGAPEGDRYANATAGYMEDYLRNLQKLAKRDRENVAAVGDLAQFEAARRVFRSPSRLTGRPMPTG